MLKSGTDNYKERKKLTALFDEGSPRITILMCLPVIVGLLIYSVREQGVSLLYVVLMFLTGLLTWTLVEYVVHRFAFHVAGRNAFLKRTLCAIHVAHHDQPTEMLTLQVIQDIGLTIAFFGTFSVLLGERVLVFYAGFLLGYLVNCLIHYGQHTMKAPFRFLENIWEHHLAHHDHEKRAFGVSTCLWDRIFRTMP